jgi:FixJ family two-component response regulator
VDDEKEVRRALERVVRSLNWEAEGAATVGEALFKVENEGPWHALILDRKLRDEDGLDVVRAAAVIKRAIPVLAVTGITDHEQDNECVRLGIAVARKPDVRSCVEAHLARARCSAAEWERCVHAVVEDVARTMELRPYGRKLLMIIAGNVVVPGSYAEALGVSEDTMEGVRRELLRKFKVGYTSEIRNVIFERAGKLAATRRPS